MIDIIALMGATGAGKTTTAAMLASRYEGHALAFSESLKDAARLAGWDGVKDDNGRALIQKTAEEEKHKHGEDVFASRTLVKAASFGGVVVIDDLRHAVELAVLTQARFAGTVRTLTLIDFFSDFAENYWSDVFNNHMKYGGKGTSWAAHRSELEWRAFRHVGRRVLNMHDLQEKAVSDVAGIFESVRAEAIRAEAEHV